MTFWSILRQRCWGLVLVVAGVCVITFIISHLIPGDPARLLAGDRASDAIVENIRQQLGLDQPLYVQFYRYVSDLFQGDLGTSIRTGRPVLEELRIFFPATLELAFCALLLALLIGIPLGILSAVWRNRWLDHLVRIMAITGISTPAFWLGLGVIVLFYGHLQILPGGGRLDDWLDPPTHVTGFYLALSSQPDVIVLDEPTSALDISVQAQILNLLVTLQENRGLTYVLISHNVSVIRHMSDRVAVMYLGQIVELGDAQQVLTAPAHPYTRLLLDSLPAIDKPLEEEWALRKTDLPGNRTLPQGCFFRERCPLATHGCKVRQSLTIREDGREIRCWRAL
ncbi:oligopeptide/dipeptide ABC transporter ATP-binding protein [Escherichia coli]|uniref:oligopeptide/dipeptide ABC transporter ATP-binding protein n=1 Tax=Escherichia coli TaxID=562 RepID=UPI00339BDFDA